MGQSCIPMQVDNPEESGDDDADKQQDDAKEEIDEAAQEQATDDLALAIIMGIVSGRSTPPPPDSGEKSKDRDKSRERSDRERAPGPPRDGECMTIVCAASMYPACGTGSQMHGLLVPQWAACATVPGLGSRQQVRCWRRSIVLFAGHFARGRCCNYHSR